MKRIAWVLIVLLGVAALAMATGPRPDTKAIVIFDPAAIGDDPQAWLATEEAKVANIKPGAEKEIIWADPATKARTAVSVVYIHGFSATKMETRPVSDNVAKALGANLYYTRLAGHGRDGDAMLEASLDAWVNDVAEALAIGKMIGDKVVVITTSTGGTLATWAAGQPELAAKMDALVLISPNYAIQGASIGLLNMPWGETILPLVLGKQRSFEPSNPEHGKWWTTSYPSKAVFPMGALLKTVEAIDVGTIKIPALFLLSLQDKVVVPTISKQVFDKWGGEKQWVAVPDAEDPYKHVIAGDILSPKNTAMAVEAILAFLKGKI